MNKYKINPHKKIISKICPKIPSSCNLTEVIITPEIKQWQIFIDSIENISEENLRDAEKFLSEQYEVDAKIIFTLKEISANVIPFKNPAPAKNIKPEKKSAAENSNGNNKILGKINGEVTAIENIKDNAEKIIVEGEIGADIEKVTYGYGVNLREFKGGLSVAKFSCAGSITLKLISASTLYFSAKNFSASRRFSSVRFSIDSIEICHCLISGIAITLVRLQVFGICGQIFDKNFLSEKILYLSIQSAFLNI